MKESIRNMVKGMIQENNQKEEQLFTEMISELKIFISSMNTTPNQQEPTPTSSTQNPATVNSSNLFISSFVDLTSHTHTSTNNNYQMATQFTKIEFPRFDGDDLEGWLSSVKDFSRLISLLPVLESS